MTECLQVFGFSFQLRPKQPSEGSALLVSDLNYSIKYKGEENPQTIITPWNDFHTWFNIIKVAVLFWSMQMGQRLQNSHLLGQVNG